MSLVDRAGNPIGKTIKFILDGASFCKKGGCEGFRLAHKGFTQGKWPNPMTVMCITCKDLIRDNDCSEMFLKQNGLEVPSEAEREPPTEILTGDS